MQYLCTRFTLLYNFPRVPGSSLISVLGRGHPLSFSWPYVKQREIAGGENREREDAFCDAVAGHMNHRWEGQQRQRETMVSRANEHIRVSR